MNTIIVAFAFIGALLSFCHGGIFLYRFIRDLQEALEAKHVVAALEKQNASLRRQLEDSEARKESFKAAMLDWEKTCTCRPITNGSYRNKQNPDPIPVYDTEPLRGNG